MLGKLFECEADKNKKYYRVIQTIGRILCVNLQLCFQMVNQMRYIIIRNAILLY